MENKIALIMVSIFLLAFNVPNNAFAQERGFSKGNGTEIKNFSAGRTLTDNDIAFLDGINNGGVKSRGNAGSVVIDGKKYVQGQTITQEDEKLFESKIAVYAKEHPNKKKSMVSRGGGPVCEDDCECCLECDGKYIWHLDKDGNCVCTCLERRNPKIPQGGK